MKRIFLTTAGLLALLHSFSQSPDTSSFALRKLKLEEINLVSSYYKQDGDNAAVTGGIGTQQLGDIANVVDVKLSVYDKKMRKHTFSGEIGVDHYTSASSDKIDLQANSSASHADTRFYPTVSWSMEDEQRGFSVGGGLSSSTEFDYQSFGGNIFFAKKTKDRSGEFMVKLQAYLDQVSLIAPIELRVNGSDDYPTASRKSFACSLSHSQIINQRLQVTVLADVTTQQGFLSLPFYRVYFTDGTVHQEKLPDSRFKIPLGFRANYFVGDKIIVRAYYRYYTDNWKIHSNTANIEIPIKITPFISVSPYYRYYNQTGAKYFSPYKVHTGDDLYYTSNYDLSAFRSHFAGMGIRMVPPKGVLGLQHFNMLELRYGHYMKNIGMKADIVSINLKFK